MARMTSRQMWTAKLAGKPVPARTPGPSRGTAPAADFFQKKAFIGIVLGIDPSLRGTGLALIEFHADRTPVLLRCWTVKVPSSRTIAVALAAIHRSVAEIIGDAASVRHVALEQTIYVQNFQTAQILGAARGAAITAAALQGIPVFEYAPLRVKQAVAGSGRASKEQMARSVRALLGHGRSLPSDEADAAGVALCHAFSWQP